MSSYVEKLEKSLEELQEAVTKMSTWAPRWHVDKKPHLATEEFNNDVRIHWYQSAHITYGYVLPMIELVRNERMLVFKAMALQTLSGTQRNTKNCESLESAKQWIEQYTKTQLYDVTINY